MRCQSDPMTSVSNFKGKKCIDGNKKMGVCRRIFKHYEPTELTICVTIYSEPRSPPKFDKWNISKPGYPPRIISCSKGSTNDANRENRSRRKVVKKRKKSNISNGSGKSEKREEIENVELEVLSDQPILHSDSATLISDDVGGEISGEVYSKCDVDEKKELMDTEMKKLESRDRHVSITSLDSIAGLGGIASHTEDSDDVIVKKTIDEENYFDDDKTTQEEELKQKENKKKYDLLSNGDVEIPTIQLMINDNGTPKKKVIVRRKKKSATPESAPRYRDFTETSINMYIEMNKQNIGEFVWDQQCTRIDAIVAPIPELDRFSTPEIPVEIEIFD